MAKENKKIEHKGHKTAQGSSTNTRYKHKQKKANNKPYRGQGR